MTEVLFGAVLLILAAGMVLLFAMLGELQSRLPTQSSPSPSSSSERSQDVRSAPEARVGARPEEWPDSLAGRVEDADPLFVLVLSPSCTTCLDVAGQLAAELDGGTAGDLALVVSSGHRDRGAEFVERHGLRRLPHYVDEGGKWVSGEFDIKMSPVALVVRRGRLESALIFHDIGALRAKVSDPKGTPR